MRHTVSPKGRYVNCSPWTQALQTRVNKLTWADGSGRSTRLLTIGHSFGGLIVYTALHQYLIDGAAVLAESSEPVPVPAFGDLGALVNPAFEAVRYEPIREIIRQQNAYVRKENPVLVAVTSKGDWATGYAFPAGRIASTIVEGFKDDAERKRHGRRWGTTNPSGRMKNLRRRHRMRRPEPYLWPKPIDQQDQRSGVT